MFKKIRSIIIAILLIVAADIAISYASSVPILPDSPRPERVQSINSPATRTSSVPILPDSPRPDTVEVD